MGKEILFVDLKQATVAESLAAIADFERSLQGRSEHSVLVLTDVTACAYDPSLSTRWKAAHRTLSPLIRGSAVYGLSGMVAVALRGFIAALRLMGLTRFGDDMRLYGTRAEALAWLHQC
jgi:hypothetical protein